MMLRKKYGVIFGACLLCFLPGLTSGSLPNADLVCPPDTLEVDKYQVLRALSLDLRGTIPTLDEYAILDEVDEVPEWLIDDWLEGDEFLEQTVRNFREIFWPNITNFPLTNFRSAFSRESGSLLYWRKGVAATYRSKVIPCRDAEVDPGDTEIVTVGDGSGGVQEGYRWILPYWESNPTKKIKVCAFDAQEALVSPTATPCGTLEGQKDPACGCGPDLRWCRYGSNYLRINKSMAEAFEKRIAAVIGDDLPYMALFEDKRAWINGPISFFLHNQVGVPRINRFTPRALPLEDIPVLDFLDDTWVEITLPDYHSGLLTDPMYLLRFQTNRSRANRFYNGFLCEPFEAPEKGIALASTLHPDLQQREGCDYCHGRLEPAAAFWGRWGETGAGYLNPVDFPPLRADCETCALTGQLCGDDCKRFYLVNAASPAEEPYLGMLNSYVFRYDDHMKNVEAGPQLLAMKGVVDHRFPQCVYNRAVEQIFGRSTEVVDKDWIDMLAVDFAASNYSYRSLVKQIVMSDGYRRLR